MLKIFTPNDKNFTSNGDKILNAVKAKIHKEDNGDYYLDLECSLDYINYIIPNNIIAAPTPQGEQAFRVVNVNKTRKKITAKCYHVFYDSKNYLIQDSDIVDKNCNEALNTLNISTDSKSPFITISDITKTDSYHSIRETLYNSIMTVLEKWGGHLVRDNFKIAIQEQIGQDNGVTVKYAKNLKDITCEENWDNVVTKLLPVGKEEVLLNAVDTNADIYLYSDIQYDIPYTKTVSFNQEINQEDYKDAEGNTDAVAYQQALVEDLRQQAQNYIDENKTPQVNYTLSANIEKLTDIGDTIEVIDDRLGLNLLTHVISFDYDCILGQYTGIEFGNFTKKLSNLVSSITAKTDATVKEATNNMAATLKYDLTAATDDIWNTLNDISDNTQSAMTRSLKNNLTGLTQNTNTKIPLDLQNSAGERLNATSDGGIRIGTGVSKILVSGRMSITTTIEGNKNLRIIKNSYSEANTIGWNYNYIRSTTNYENIIITPILADVKEGDIIYLTYYTENSKDTIGGSSYGAVTSLTVETIG